MDQCTCFVGANESGKTNLLLPLWKFNPAAEATSIDMLLDYPRDEYSNHNKEEPFIEVLFSLTKEEQERFQEQNKADCNPPESEEEEEDDDAGNESKIKPIKFTQYLLIAKNYKRSYYVYVSDEKCERRMSIGGSMGDKLWGKIRDPIPKFIYYEEYGNLDANLFLPRVIEDLDRSDPSSKERMRARTLKTLFGHLKLDPQEILELGQESRSEDDAQIEEELSNKKDREAKVSSAATRLTTEFRNWWTRGDYVFHFKVDGDYFFIKVSDADRHVEIELESRSKGLQWFFSFFLVFLAEREGEHRDCILLLDEPGLHLHPNAQKDLIKFFAKLSERNQLIYTTHLPFLVDHQNLDRVKAVYTEKGLTKVSNDLSKADKEKRAIQPVNAAIGITASESLLIDCHIVIVEGISDQFYLTMIKNYLVAKKSFRPNKEMVFMPVHGVKGIKPVVSILHGRDAKLPVVMLDSDTAGKAFQKNLKKELYKSQENKVLETDTYTNKKSSEIEDLMPSNLIAKHFTSFFRPDEDPKINGKKSIIPQLKKFLIENSIEEIEGWKVEISKRIKQKFQDKDIPDDMQERWAKLFKDIQDNSK